MSVQSPGPGVTDEKDLSTKAASVLSTLMVERTNSIYTQAFRFVIFGFIAMAVDFGALSVSLMLLHITHQMAVAIGFLFGLTTIYILSIKWVFASRSMENKLLEFVTFAIIGVIGLGLTEWIVTAGVNHFAVDPRHPAHRVVLGSKVVATVVVAFWNFTSRRVILFREKKHPR